MDLLFGYPGRCGRATCSRDSLTCNAVCNSYAMLVDAEFPPNTDREDHLLDALGRQIHMLYGYYFGLGSYLLSSLDAHPPTLAVSSPEPTQAPIYAQSVASNSSTQPTYEDISPVNSPPEGDPTNAFSLNQEFTHLVSGLFSSSSATPDFSHVS